MLLNNQQITEDIKKEIKICIETNENENTTTQNLWDTVKTDKDGHCIMIKGSIQEEYITIINIYAPNIGTPQYLGQMLTK